MARTVGFDRRAGTPLYRQIATRVRYRIAMGDLRPGDLLPSLRDAEEELGVSLHTVRRAYRMLEDEGLVETVERSRTRVVVPGTAGVDLASDIDAFARWVADLGRDRLGVTPAELAERISRIEVWAAPDRILVAECSIWLAEVLADQVRERWDVPARACLLEDLQTRPAMPVLSTLYHAGQVRETLGSGHQSLEFILVELDPSYVRRLRTLLTGDPPRCVVCGVDRATVEAISSDLVTALGSLETRAVISRTPERVVAESDPAVPIVVTPQNWDRLAEAQRSLPHVLAHRSRFRPDALDALGARMGWRGVPGRAAETAGGVAGSRGLPGR